METTKHELNKTFSTFITRWRANTAPMRKCHNKKGHLQIMVKNLLLVYYNHLFTNYFPSFKALIGVGTQIKHNIANG